MKDFIKYVVESSYIMETIRHVLWVGAVVAVTAIISINGRACNVEYERMNIEARARACPTGGVK